jgi:hypothetical protein
MRSIPTITWQNASIAAHGEGMGRFVPCVDAKRTTNGPSPRGS